MITVVYDPNLPVQNPIDLTPAPSPSPAYDVDPDADDPDANPDPDAPDIDPNADYPEPDQCNCAESDDYIAMQATITLLQSMLEACQAGNGTPVTPPVTPDIIDNPTVYDSIGPNGEQFYGIATQE